MTDREMARFLIARSRQVDGYDSGGRVDDYLPYAQPSENIEDRRDEPYMGEREDPRLSFYQEPSPNRLANTLGLQHVGRSPASQRDRRDRFYDRPGEIPTISLPDDG